MIRRPSTPSQDGPTLIPKVDDGTPDPDFPREVVRWIYEPDPGGWTDFALSEWSLTRAGAVDRHTHSETNIVLEGELHVECDGTTVVARVGDTVTVPGGSTGRYWAPVYARMIAVYGANPDGIPPTEVSNWEL